jgi:hypothetical protein
MKPRNRGKAARINPYDPTRADKWGYTDEEIRRVIPGLEPTPGSPPCIEGERMPPKYPQVHVRLIGEDGNAFTVLGKVNQALRQAGISQAERDAFRQEATAGDYDHLLQTVMRWVEVA